MCMERTVMLFRIRFILFMRGWLHPAPPVEGATGYPLAGVPVIAKET
jgi:hypothetical protein